VVRDQGGKPYTVRYEAVNAMLLNEFLKEHRTVRELEQEVAVLAATVKEQATNLENSARKSFSITSTSRRDKFGTRLNFRSQPIVVQNSARLRVPFDILGTLASIT
jgi:hypothetical protein